MLNPQQRPPTVRFRSAAIAGSALVVDAENGVTMATTIDRLPVLGGIPRADLEELALSPDRFYVCWPQFGVRLSYADVSAAASGGDKWDRRPLESKLCEQALELDRLGNPAEAIEIARLALLISIESGAPNDIGRNAGNLGMFYANVGRRQEAKSAFLRALDCAKKTAYSELEANSLGNLGVLCVEDGEYRQGIDLLTQSLRIHLAAKNFGGQSVSFGELGAAFCGLGELEMGLACLARAIALAKRANSEHMIQRWQENVNQVRRATGLSLDQIDVDRLTSGLGGGQPGQIQSIWSAFGKLFRR